jgi:mannose-6-phosphate isomerase-like protein (cupin superfamily)
LTSDYVVFDRRPGRSAGFEELELPAMGASFILVDMRPGEGVRLHRHAYAEVFVVHEGVATFTVGEATLEAHPQQVVIVAPGVPHKFANSGSAPLRQTDIHLSGGFVTEWLE